MFKPLMTGVIGSVLLLSIATASDPSQAQNNHYRWVDGRGNPVYSDRPPAEGVDYEVVAAGSSLKRVVSAEEGAVPAEIEPRVGNEFEQVNTTDSGVLKKNPVLCENAQKDLEALTASEQVRVRNAQGEVQLLTPEEKQIEKVRAQERVKVYCD